MPDPLRKPSGSIDEVAAALAKQVAVGDEQSVPALLTAILTAGFALRDRDGVLLQTVQPGQGLAFDAWEVAAMAKMYGEGRSVQLVYLTDGLKAIPELKGMPLDSMLLEGIRKHTQGEQPLLRFWARFIVELGRQQKNSYDMLRAADPRSVRLDAIQAALILRRLVGDLYAAGGDKQASDMRGGRKTHVADIVTVAGWRQSPRFARAALWESSFAPSSKARTVDTIETAHNEKPCAGMGSDPIQDLLATELTSAWGRFFGDIKLGKGDTKLGNVVNVANIILAYAKFIATYAALETEITVENPPLVRTLNARPGERRQLTATVKMDVGGWDQINCFRSALNLLTGLDFSLLDDGPLEGIEVNWNLNEGGAGDAYSNRTGVTGKQQIVGFAGNNSPRIQSAGTHAGIAGSGGTPVGNLTRSKTDKEGKARIYLEGSPKIPYVVEPAAPVMKQAVVSTTIKMKGGDIEGDAVDLWGQLRGGLSGLATLPLELLYRTDWASSGYVVVPVEDHEPCTGHWSGTINYTSSYKREFSGEGANNISYENDEVVYTADIELSNKQDGYGKPLALARAQASEVRERGGRGTTGCYRTSKQLHTVNGSAEAPASVTVSVRADGRYDLSYSLPIVHASGSYTVTSKVGGTCRNPYNRELNQNDPVKDHEISPGFSIDHEGVVDPKKPSVLTGSKTVTKEWKGTGKATVHVTWNLVSCGTR
ncbi:MAG TPA: hypothetical protein VM943_00135 [Pyrinomonadaceae bacterium]|nr:hypothetical protein [Pyrinomonadaceae bacterium]